MHPIEHESEDGGMAVIGYILAAVGAFLFGLATFAVVFAAVWWWA